LEIIGLGADGKKTVCTGVEMFRKLLDQGEAGDNVGLLLRGIDKNESNVVWYWQNRVQLNRTANLKLRFIS